MDIKHKLSDQWATPQWLFDYLNRRFDFTIDVCATKDNAKCAYFIDDALNKDHDWLKLVNNIICPETQFSFAYPVRFFMNPPYSNGEPFIRRAWEESKHHQVVCLLKSDPSTKWWGIFWDYSTQQPKAGCKIEYPCYEGRNQGRRVQFEPPPKHVLEFYLENGSAKDQELARSLLAGKITTPAFASAIVIFDKRHLNLNEEI